MTRSPSSRTARLRQRTYRRVWLLSVAASLLAGGVGLATWVAADAAASSRGGTIAFVRMANDRVFGGELFVVRPDGSGLRRVTPPGTKVWSYAWSPDDKLIAYIDKPGSVWLVRPDGTGRRLLVSTALLSSTSLSWSPDGTQITIASPGANAKKPRCKTTLYVVAVDNGQSRSLDASAGCYVAWSPGGDAIAYDDARGGISVIRPDGTGRRRVASGGGPQWSGDGRELVFSVSRYSTFGVVDVDGKRFHVVTSHAYTEYPVAWAPQGRRILYGRADRKGIYVIGADSRNNHRVTRDSPPQAAWSALAWSPTGGSIAYDTGTYDNTDLYVIGADGRDKVQLTNTPGIDIAPTWVAG